MKIIECVPNLVREMIWTSKPNYKISEKEFETEEFGAYKFVPMLQDRNK